MPLIKLNNRSIKDVTSLPFGVGNMILISSQTASNSASISFTTGIDSTYKEYQFYFIDIYPRTDDVQFQFNLSTDSGSNYNVTKTTTYFVAWHDEADTSTNLSYRTAEDLAQSTSFQNINNSLGNDADQICAGSLTLFNPSSTTYVKHFISNTNNYHKDNFSNNVYMAGYGNTTSAINAVRFQMSSGNMDGTIALFGVV
jgi:hypothetical protein